MPRLRKIIHSKHLAIRSASPAKGPPQTYIPLPRATHPQARRPPRNNQYPRSHQRPRFLLQRPQSRRKICRLPLLGSPYQSEKITRAYLPRRSYLLEILQIFFFVRANPNLQRRSRGLTPKTCQTNQKHPSTNHLLPSRYLHLPPRPYHPPRRRRLHPNLLARTLHLLSRRNLPHGIRNHGHRTHRENPRPLPPRRSYHRSRIRPRLQRQNILCPHPPRWDPPPRRLRIRLPPLRHKLQQPTFRSH